MIEIHSLKDESNKNKLKALLTEQYNELYGDEKKTIVSRIFNVYSNSESSTKLDLECIYSPNEKSFDTEAFEVSIDGKTCGFILLDVIKDPKKTKKTFGQVYKLFLQKKYRQDDNLPELLETIKGFIDDYFASQNVSEIIALFPTLDYLSVAANALGFSLSSKEVDMVDGYAVQKWQKNIPINNLSEKEFKGVRL